LSPVVQPGIGHCSFLGRLQQRDELLLEVDEVLVHAVLLVAPDEPADGVHAEEHRRVERPQHEIVLFLADHRVVVQQVVEVSDVGDANPALLERRLDPPRALLVERLAQVERVGDRIEHRLGRHIGLTRVERRRQLDVAGAQLAGEFDPLFNRAIRIGVADLARRQLLKSGREDANLHELRFKRCDRHVLSWP
jgi:hypothetical protein